MIALSLRPTVVSFFRVRGPKRPGLPTNSQKTKYQFTAQVKAVPNSHQPVEQNHSSRRRYKKTRGLDTSLKAATHRPQSSSFFFQTTSPIEDARPPRDQESELVHLSSTENGRAIILVKFFWDSSGTGFR